MKFGQVENPGEIDFTLPEDHPDTKRILKQSKNDLEIYVGCAKFNSKELKGLYPKSVKKKDELSYYSTQFNSIEFNGTFRTFVTKLPIEKWRDETEEGFKFFPKMSNMVSQFRRLKRDSIELSTEFCDRLHEGLGDKLGMIFVQMIDNFKPEKELETVEEYCRDFPKGTPMALEVRNEAWFGPEYSEEYYKILEKYNVTNIIVDTAGRRDMLHMRLTTPIAFVRWVGANHPTDKSRLDDWVQRVKIWKDQGLEKLCFFVHQHKEEESPALAAYFIEQLNKELGTDLKVPELAG